MGADDAIDIRRARLRVDGTMYDIIEWAGEHREYEGKRGAFGRVIPREDFRWRKGLGAWQVGVRYSRLDLQLNGGLLQDVTLGLNWFFNSNLKLQANYVSTDRDAPAGSPAGAGGSFNGFGIRMAHDF